MSWPLSQDYNEAIQDPGTSFSDAELKTGEVVCNALGIPMPRSGNFADVYEVRCPSGSRWAVKCFTREVAGLRERYAEISKYLRQANLPFMVDFQYLEQGMRIRGQWYPILKMQWVEGFVLNEFVRENLDKKPILNALGQIWTRMAKRLREAKLAHCDLQHGNVLFVPGSSANSLAVKLIDYDGMCVPSLAGTQSGEVGHPAFQHPERLRTGAYNQEVDRFSLLTIAAGLRCLTVGGRALWDKYDTGDNLLFRQSDLQNPQESPLFQELLAIREPQTQTLVKELYRACQGPLEAVPLLTELLPEEKPAVKVAVPEEKSASKVAMSVVHQPVAVAAPVWDNLEEVEEEVEASVVKRQRKQRVSKGTSLWLWGGLGAAAALLVSVGVGIALRKGSSAKQDAPVAKQSETKTSAPVKPPADGGQRKPQEPPQGVPDNRDKKNALPGSPEPVALSSLFHLTPDASALAVLSDDLGCSWRLTKIGSNQLIREFKGHTAKIHTLVFTPDGKYAATAADDKKLKVWDVENGKELHEVSIWTKRAADVAISNNGKRVAFADGDGGVHILDFDGKSFPSYVNKFKVTCSAFSPDGEILFCGRNNTPTDPNSPILCIDLNGSKPIRFDRGAMGRVFRIAASPDGKYLATTHEGNPNVVRLWESATGKLLDSLDLPGAASRELIFSPDSRLLLVESEKGYHFFLVGTPLQQVMRRLNYITQKHVTAAFTADSRSVMFAYGKSNAVSTRKRELPLNALTPSTDPQTSPTVAWNRPMDPDGDCKFQRDGVRLTITVPGKDHDLGAERGKMNAPRLLLNAEGDFTAQVRVGGEFQPSTDATADGKIPVVGAGLVLMVDDKTYVRLERFVLYRGQQQESFVNWELRQNAQAVFSQPSAQVSAKEVYLRLKRQSDKLIGSLSTDGQSWTELKPIDLSLLAKVAVGIDAITTSSKPFSPSFEQFQLQRGSGEMARVEWPSLTTPEAIAVKPPRMPPPTRRNRRKPVPDASEIEAARKDIRSRHKTAFESGNQGQLMNALFNDLNQSRTDPPRHFALWREIRNESAKQNLRSGLSQAQSLARDFDVDSLLMKCEAFELSYRSLRPQPADFVSMGLPLLDQAIAEENYDVLTRLVKIVEPSASALRPEDSNRLLALPILMQAKRVKQEHDKLQAERKVLENNAEDAKANLAVGKFHCAVRGDWGDGLPMLARGRDPALKALAEKDLANPDDAAAEIALAKDWLKYALNPSLTKSMRLACQKRGYYWYQQAAAQVKGDKLKAVQSSLAALAKTPELQSPWWQFGIYSRAQFDATTGYLRLQPPNGMTTREYYRGPIDITVVARSMTVDLHIDIGAGGRLIVDQDFRTKKDHLQVFRPDGESGSFGTQVKRMEVDLSTNRPYTIRWQVTEAGMKVWLDGNLVIEERHDGYNLSDKYPVSIRTNSQPIEIKSATVRRGPEK